MTLGIKVFAAYYPPHRGGYECTVSELAERVAADGHDLTVITCDLGLPAPSREMLRGVRVYRLPSWKLLDGTYVIPKPTLSTIRLLREALAGRFDIVHTHTRFFPTTWLGLIVSIVARKPLLHTEHGAGHSRTGSRFVSIINQVVDHLLGLPLMRVARVVAISTAAAEFCRHIGARNVEIIPDGVDTAIFRPRPSPFRELHAIGADEIVIAFVGRLVWGKGAQDLVAAWPCYGAENVRVVVVGEGPMRGDLETLATRVKARILFMGGLDPQGVCDVLTAADLFVSPTYTEGLGLTLIEAGAAGLPAVACGIEGVLDVVLDNQSGLLVPVADIAALGQAVRRLVIDPHSRREMGATALEHVRTRFDWHTTAAAYVNTFMQMAQTHRNTSGPPRLDTTTSPVDAVMTTGEKA